MKLRIQIYKNAGGDWGFMASFYENVPETTIPARTEQRKQDIAFFNIL